MKILPILHSKRRWLAVLLAVIAAVSLSACRPARSTTLVNRLIVPTPSGPGTFNYPLNQSAYSIFGYIYEGSIDEKGLSWQY